jgi:hypothetical protein
MEQRFSEEVNSGINALERAAERANQLHQQLSNLTHKQMQLAASAKHLLIAYYNGLIQEHLDQLNKWQADSHWIKLKADDQAFSRNLNALNWRKNSLVTRRMNVFLGLSDWE